MDRAQGTRNATPDMRGLKALVIGLGVLIVLGTALVIGVVIKRIVESTGASHAKGAAAKGAVLSRAAGPVPPFDTVLAGPGSAVAGIAGAGGLVAIWVRDGHGGRVVFIDPRTGARVGTARVR